MQEFWSGLPSRIGNGASSSTRKDREDTHIEPRSALAAQPRDLTFTSVEGDFQARIELMSFKLSIPCGALMFQHWE